MDPNDCDSGGSWTEANASDIDTRGEICENTDNSFKRGQTNTNNSLIDRDKRRMVMVPLLLWISADQGNVKQIDEGRKVCI